MLLSRKEFIKSSAILAGAALTGFSLVQKRKLLLSFSTLGCPDWTFQQIVDFAADNNYSALEIRGINREMNLAKSPGFTSPAEIASTLALMKQKGLRFINLGTSSTLHFADGEVRDKNIAEGKAAIDLAQQLHCPYIRIFPNLLPKGTEKAVTLGRIAAGLRTLADYAKDRNVTVLMETHGEVVWSDDIVTVMQQTNRPNVGLVWDIVNMWTVTKESPDLVYNKLKKYIRHVHVKDAKLTEKEPVYVLMGRGVTPVFDALNLLKKDRYPGYYSFEWEKLWHPELAGPELALADYSKVMMERLK